MATYTDNPEETNRLDRTLEIEESPPRDTETGAKAWFCVIGAFLFIIPSFGFMQSIGTIQSYLYLNQLKSYSIGSVGWITGLYLFLSYFLNIQVGPLCDSYAPTLIAPIGVLTTTASFLLLAECSQYWQFMLCLGVLGAAGGAIIGTLAVSVIAQVFVRRRGVAMGIALTGSSTGSIIIPIMLRSTLPSLGWAWSMRLMALVIGIITALGAACFMPYFRTTQGTTTQPQSGRGAGGRRIALLNLTAFKSIPFIFLSLAMCLLEFAIFAIAGLLPTLATTGSSSFTGENSENSYTLIAVLSAGSCLGRIIPGIAADLVGPFNVILIMTALTLVFMGSLFIPFAGKSEGVLYAFSALWGFGSGSFLSISPVCLGATCDLRSYGRFYGTMTFLVSFAVLLAVPLSGLMLDHLGTQPLASLLTGILFLGGIFYILARGALLGRWLSLRQKV